MGGAVRAFINRLRRWVWHQLFGRMVFGEQSVGALRPATRLSPTVLIENGAHLRLADDVFVGHFVFIEASAGVQIDAGVQITNFVSIVSHSTHRSVRVAKALSGTELAADFGATSAGMPNAEGALPGDRRAGIAIGAHSFIGPHSTLEAGTRLGVCCLVASHSRVRGVVPDFAIVAGQPAQVVGDVREGDMAWLAAQAAAHGVSASALHGAYQRWVLAVAQAGAGVQGGA